MKPTTAGSLVRAGTHAGRCIFAPLRPSQIIEGGTVYRCVRGCSRLKVKAPEGYTTRAAADRSA